MNTQRADLDWPNLSFGFLKTDFNIRYTWRDGHWGEGVLSTDDNITMHMAATCLHYGQECFEGLKAFEQKDGSITVFRVQENARRMIRSCERIFMQPPPEDLFVDAVLKVVNANRRFVPPYGTGASLYVRPLVLGTGPQVGVTPADEYLFLIFVTPVGPYFKHGFKPVHLVVEEEFDRAAPSGVGDVKVGGNYAAGLRASIRAKGKGFTDVLYLDAREKKYIDESGPANFFGITGDGRYVTPQSRSILPSITNSSLMTLAPEVGLKVEHRKVEAKELFTFEEAGCCGTAAVITPIGSVTWGDKKIVFSDDDNPGPCTKRLYERLTGIQTGDAEDPHGWNTVVPKE